MDRRRFAHPLLVGFPIEDKAYDGEWQDDHKNCPGPDGGKHSGYHTRWFADVLAYGYAAGGDKDLLEFARKVWSRGTKRGYWSTSQEVPDDEVAAFAGHSAPKGDQIDIRNCLRLFYEVPRAKTGGSDR